MCFQWIWPGCDREVKWRFRTKENHVQSLDGSVIKNLPTTQETQVWPLGEEDSLEKEMATHSSILAWRIPWTEEPGWLQSKELQRVGHD